MRDDGRFHIIDWDTLILAPAERDLMFIGSGIGGVWTSEREISRFYDGYRTARIDPGAIAYFRCERVIQDIAAYGNQLLRSTDGGADRAASLRQLAGQFDPGGIIDIALGTPLSS